MVDKGKIDEMIDFFKTQNKGLDNWYSKKSKEIEYPFKISLTLIGIFLTLFGALIIFVFQIAVYGITILLVLLLISIIADTKSRNDLFKKYAKIVSMLEVIVSFLQNLKIINPNVDLSPLEEKFYQFYHDVRIVLKDYDEKWLEEFMESLGKVNVEVERLKNNP
jgi:hypothetical protein